MFTQHDQFSRHCQHLVNVITDLLGHPDTPHVMRAALCRLVDELRESVTAVTPAQIEAAELRGGLLFYIGLIEDPPDEAATGDDDDGIQETGYEYFRAHLDNRRRPAA